MVQKGTHTWDIVIHYHRCPACGCILESREDYHYQLGKYLKELDCYRCHHHFSVEKKASAAFGPLWDQEWKMFG